jgi:aspartate dehydrogenase
MKVGVMKVGVMKVGVIGYGAIGRTLVAALAPIRGIEVAGILVRGAKAGPEGMPMVTDAAALLALGVEAVVECAGHGGLKAHGAAVLAGGVDLVVASVGALADRDLDARLRAAGGRLVIPSGAVAGLDALGAAREAGLDSVDYVGRKPPQAWRGTPAEKLIDLDGVTEPAVFFESDARTAALTFPQNANVVAAVALAGLGFEATRVTLMVDPSVPNNQHQVTARGAFGEVSTHVIARTLPDNPKTSMLAPFSLVRALRMLSEPLVV